MATRKSPPKKKTASRKPARKPARPELRMPQLDDHQLDILGLGLVGLAAFFDPDGEMSVTVDSLTPAFAAPEALLLEPVRKLVAQACYARHVGKVPRIVTAELGGDAGLIGAASLGNVI